MEREGWQIKLCVVVSAILVGVFVVYPLWRVLGAATLSGLINFFQTPYFVRPFINSIVLASAVGLLGTVIGFVMAYAVERASVPFKKVFDVVGVIPVVAPPFVVAISAIMLFGRNGIIVKYILGGHEIFSVYGFWGLLLTETLAYFPTAYLVLKGTLAAIHPTFEDAARSMGASRVTTFLKVTAPLATPGIMSAFLLVFIESLADFGNPLILSGSYQVLSVQAYLQITALYDTSGGACLAIMLLLPSLVVYILQKYYVGRKSYITVAGKAARGIRRSGITTKSFCTMFCLAIFAGMMLFYGMILIGAFVKLWGVNYSVVLDNFTKGLQMGWQYVFDSVWIAAVSAPITGLIGIIIGYIVTRKKFFGRGILEFASMLAFAVPGTVIGIGYVMAFNEPHWFLPVALQGTAWIILILFVFRNMPVGMQSAVSGLNQIDVAMEEAARTLGASGVGVFLKIVLPLLMPAFLSGLVYSFVRAMTQISAVIFVVSGNWNLLTVFLLGLVENGELSVAAAVAVILIVIILLVLGVLKFVLHQWQVSRLVKAPW